jgi:ribosomal protein S18 acetylase RimI-like enzyme
VIFRIPTAIRAWIEDVVVDDSVRGRGVGEALVQASLKLALERGAKTTDLTSRTSRKAAHRLYEKSGFHVRDTSVYRHGPKPAS